MKTDIQILVTSLIEGEKPKTGGKDSFKEFLKKKKGQKAGATDDKGDGKDKGDDKGKADKNVNEASHIRRLVDRLLGE